MATDTRKRTEVTGTRPRREPNRRSRLLVGVATAMLALIVGLGTWAIVGGGGEAASPQAVVEGYYEALNAGDVAAIMEFFSEESEIVNHPLDLPVTRGGPLRGLAAIQEIAESDSEFSADQVEPFKFSNVEVSGNTVTWDFRIVIENQATNCSDGHSAIVENGKILLWTFAPQHPCPS